MNRKNKENNDFIYDAVTKLEQITGKDIDIESSRKEYDGILTIDNIQFTVEAESTIRKSNKGVVLNRMQQLKEISNHPIIIIVKYIATDVAVEFKEKGYNYIDIAGNCHIHNKNIFYYISGQKTQKISKKNQSRAFQESGIKLVFNLLRSPENLQLSYRKLSEISDVSVGSISNIMVELEELNFLLKTNNKRILKNTPDLLNRWIISYNEVLKPRLLNKRMRFSDPYNYKDWNKFIIKREDHLLWGAEPAASILTGKLRPEKYTIYTDESWQMSAKKFKLVPDDKGEVEIYDMFWRDDFDSNAKPIVPTLLIYADLISSGFDRNLEIAKIILDNELQYIK